MGNFTKRTIAITATVAAIAGAGVAFAAWTSSGTGTGTATAGSAQNLVITQQGSVTGLFPTGNRNVSFTVQNPNPYAVTLNQATATGFAPDSPAHTTCNATSLSAAPVSLSTVTIPAGGTSAAQTINVAMNNTANDACQGATFTFSIAVTGASS